MRILVVAPNRHKLAELTASLAYAPGTEVITREVISISDAHAFGGMEFDAAIGLNTIFPSIAAYLSTRLRSSR